MSMKSRFSPQRRERLLNVAEFRRSPVEPLLPDAEAPSGAGTVDSRNGEESASLGHFPLPLE
jgi:hypothetical protein